MSFILNKTGYFISCLFRFNNLVKQPRFYYLIDLWKSENRFGAFLNWNEIEKIRHFGGIRNEEDFMATENGFRKLGKDKPKSIQEIEGLRNQPAS